MNLLIYYQGSSLSTSSATLVQNYAQVHGLRIQSLESKLESFFNQRVLPGLPYDTFVLYYSGPVHDNGDWASLENNAFSSSQLLSLWEKVNGETKARLILILDTENSHKWLPEV